MSRFNVDLDDFCLVGIELPPGEVSAEQQENIAVQDCFVPRRAADHAGHPDVVGIVVGNEVFSSGRVRHRSF